MQWKTEGRDVAQRFKMCWALWGPLVQSPAPRERKLGERKERNKGIRSRRKGEGEIENRRKQAK